MTAELTFTQDWFSSNVDNWRKYLSHLAGQPDLCFLEIGCFEGRATVWLLQNILTHETSRIWCIDTFTGNLEHRDRGLSLDGIEGRFDHNIRSIGCDRRVTKVRGRSAEALRPLPLRSYDFVYIDGSHLAADVLEDAVLSFRLLKPGGIMIFDDYEWRKYADPLWAPKPAIDAFLGIYAGQYDLVLKNYQVILEVRRNGA